MLLYNALELELSNAALAFSSVDFARAKSQGLLSAGLLDAGWRSMAFGAAFVTAKPDGLYYPSPDGTRALILPIVEGGSLVDLLAVRTDKPDEWLLRLGRGTVLGLPDGLSHTIVDPVPVARNPVSWLRGGAAGLCVVDWTAPDLIFLNDLPGLVAEDAEVEKRLRSALTRPVHLAPIFRKELRHAA